MVDTGIRWQVIVVDPLDLIGESVWAFLTWLGVDDYGAYTVINEPRWIVDLFAGEYIIRNNSIVAATTDLVSATKECVQLDWFTFMFAESQSQALDIADMPLFKQQLEFVGLSVTGVDNGYFYVYTSYDDVANRLIEAHPQAEVRRGPIDELDFPV